ncbi:MAG TPA: preprotein translocase subunit SecY [Candidatus Angelobacter sp.]|nr:preprotein translocase subunit SecY [Candidatus Angelobacter sp.]
MFEKLANIFRVPDLRKRVLFTLAMLAVYRLGGHIPTPGINAQALQRLFEQNLGGALGLIDLFSGRNMRQMTVFALGIMPYITASIILQLLTVVYEPLAKLQKEGELGRKKITQWTRYLTVVLSALQSLGIAYTLMKKSTGDVQLVINPGPGFVLLAMLTLTAGSVFIMWLGEQITERGVGNGMSLLIFAGIVSGLPVGIAELWDKVKNQTLGGAFAPLVVAMLVILFVGVVAFIVFVERSERRITVQYARRVVGRKVVGGQYQHLPLRVNAGGVMPVIFASSILTFPAMVFGSYLQNSRYFKPLLDVLHPSEPIYMFLYSLCIIFFAYFYVSIVFNPTDVADNMRKYGGFIPGIRPGKRTADYINEILTRITLVGALYLIIISMIPTWVVSGVRLQHTPFVGRFFDAFPSWILTGLNLSYNVSFLFGGTSLLIVVGVAMDTVNQIESQLIMRHYEGFSRNARVKGRKLW